MSEVDVPVTVTWPALYPVHGDWLMELKMVNEKLAVAKTRVHGDRPVTVI